MNLYVEVLKKYAVFQGRASRSEFWYFNLFNALIQLVLIAAMVGAANAQNASLVQVLNILIVVYSLGVFLPSISVLVRRLHDSGRSGWWYFIVLVPIVGIFILLYFLVEDSQEGSNVYGNSPKSFTNSNNQNIDIGHTAGEEYTSPQGIMDSTQKYQEPSGTLIPENSVYPEIPLDNCPTVGRNPENDIQVNNQYLSGRHVVFCVMRDNTYPVGLGERYSPYFYVEDLNSTNGTYIDGRKLNPGEAVAITKDMRIILGSEEVVYRLKES